MKKSLSTWGKVIKIVLSLSLLSLASLSYALPFTIVPTVLPLPTTMISGSPIQVSYTVTNNTAITRYNNHVRYLPLHVTTASGGCANNFNLGPHGSSNDHCTLNLTVSGAVNGNDPDPHHHLFVCFPGDKTCAGTALPLNISVVATPPSSVLPGSLIGVSCSNDTCTAVGDSEGPSNVPNGNPLAYTSNDGGSNWSLSLTSPFPLPGGQTIGTLNGVSCIGSNCTAVGHSRYRRGEQSLNILPLAYSSNNGGSTWSLSLTSPLPLPVGQTQGELHGVSCIDSNCTAVGNSFDDNGSNGQPLAYTSNNGGSTWSLSLTSPLPLPGSQTQGFLFGVSCTGTNCTAVGDSSDSNGQNQLPLAYTSNTGGSTWVLSLTSPLPLPGGNQTEGFLSGVSCIGSNCTTVGNSSSNLVPLPLAYTSTNGGSTWLLSSPFPLPSSQTLGALLDVRVNKSNLGRFYKHSFHNRGGREVATQRVDDPAIDAQPR